MSQKITGLACAFQSVSFSFGQSRLELVARLAGGHRQPGQVALGIGQETGHAQAREPFGQHHQRHRFSGAGGAGDHAMAVAVLRVEADAGAVVAADQYVSHGNGVPGRSLDCSQPRRCIRLSIAVPTR
jgi:hypothetical protein